MIRILQPETKAKIPYTINLKQEKMGYFSIPAVFLMNNPTSRSDAAQSFLPEHSVSSRQIRFIKCPRKINTKYCVP